NSLSTPNNIIHNINNFSLRTISISTEKSNHSKSRYSNISTSTTNNICNTNFYNTKRSRKSKHKVNKCQNHNTSYIYRSSEQQQQQYINNRNSIYNHSRINNNSYNIRNLL